MSFVRLENLNDFIQPSTACIKPVEKKATGVVAKVNDINLSDCLACSGCITSAESVLVQQQNYEELFKTINDNKTSKSSKDIVVSLSLQSISSLAHKYSMQAQEAAERIASFFVSMGCHKVYDINLARHLALVESYREFKSSQEETSQSKLPIISSICPGWICYAEKTNGDLIIPHLSRVRSPQQIMGALLKKLYCSEEAGMRKRSDLFHVTLMPCFDKKLEASRQDFQDSIDESQDVDCVLTPIELEEILNNEGVTLKDFNRRKLDILGKFDCDFDQPLTSHHGSVSGGYAENLLLTLASEMLGENCDKLRSVLDYSTLKNSDFIEVNIKRSTQSGEDGDTVANMPKFAIVNGFRNIQTVVQRLKRKALKYDYIEIMACPSGCINGGAQCRPNNGENAAEMTESTRHLYSEVPVTKQSIDSNDSTNRQLYEKLNLNDSESKEDLLFTDFHSVPKMQNLTVNW